MHVKSVTHETGLTWDLYLCKLCESGAGRINLYCINFYRTIWYFTHIIRIIRKVLYCIAVYLTAHILKGVVNHIKTKLRWEGPCPFHPLVTTLIFYQPTEVWISRSAWWFYQLMLHTVTLKKPESPKGYPLSAQLPWCEEESSKSFSRMQLGRHV